MVLQRSTTARGHARQPRRCVQAGDVRETVSRPTNAMLWHLLIAFPSAEESPQVHGARLQTTKDALVYKQGARADRPSTAAAKETRRVPRRACLATPHSYTLQRRRVEPANLAPPLAGPGEAPVPQARAHRAQMRCTLDACTRGLSAASLARWLVLKSYAQEWSSAYRCWPQNRWPHLQVKPSRPTFLRHEWHLWCDGGEREQEGAV